MSDNSERDGEEPSISFDMVLEPPPASESPTAGMGSGTGSIGLFGDEAVVTLTAAKFSLVEGFLKQVTRDQTFGDFIREILLTIMKVVKSEAGSMLEVDPQKNSLFFRSVVGTSSDRVAKFVIPMGQGIVGHVAESRRPLVVSNVAENQLHLKKIGEAVDFEPRNLVAVPIIVRGRVFGVLELLNRIGEPDYTTGDVELLSYACEMAAKAIEARLMIAWSAQQRRGGKNPREAA